MGKIRLTGGFTPIPEGEYIFYVKEVDQSKLDDFGKLTVVLVTETGTIHREMFSFIKNDGSENSIAHDLFSSLARAALDLQQSEDGDVDPADLVGHYFKSEVKHYEGKDGQVRANLTWKKEHVEGFANGSLPWKTDSATSYTNTPISSSGDATEASKAAPFDLNSILG